MLRNSLRPLQRFAELFDKQCGAGFSLRRDFSPAREARRNLW